MRRHRAVFVAAGVYNIAWGLAGVLAPGWTFDLARVPITDRTLFACLAMVIGLYGLLFLDVARAPHSGRAVVAVALAGKVLGPVGAAIVVAAGEWPLGLALLFVIPNDVVWWIPFTRYLIDSRVERA